MKSVSLFRISSYFSTYFKALYWNEQKKEKNIKKIKKPRVNMSITWDIPQTKARLQK